MKIEVTEKNGMHFVRALSVWFFTHGAIISERAIGEK